MAARRRHRYGRAGQYYKVILDNGSEIVVGAAEFLINVKVGNLRRDERNPRIARARKWLRVKIDQVTGQLAFESTEKKAPAQPVRTTNRILLEEWLRADPTITRQRARERMLVSLPRVLTEAVCLY
jgi:hypothetical protein